MQVRAGPVHNPQQKDTDLNANDTGNDLAPTGAYEIQRHLGHNVTCDSNSPA